MGESETTEISRTYAIQSNTGFDHGVPHKVIGEVSEYSPALPTRDTLLLWHKKWLGGVVEEAVCRENW